MSFTPGALICIIINVLQLFCIKYSNLLSFDLLKSLSVARPLLLVTLYCCWNPPSKNPGYAPDWWKTMRTDIRKWCNGCLVCATRRPSRAIHSPLNPIPVESPFHRMWVDVIQYPKSQSENQYAIVFKPGTCPQPAEGQLWARLVY